jgi:hypothetical protein
MSHSNPGNLAEIELPASDFRKVSERVAFRSCLARSGPVHIDQRRCAETTRQLDRILRTIFSGKFARFVSPALACRSSVSVSNQKEDGMEWWVLELITVGVMIAIVGILGPLIKRFGKSYAADVFRVNPRTGKSYLVLMDFAYYMIFGAYILFSIKWEPDTGWEQQVNAEQLQGSVVRIGGMLLLMGLLHGLNVLTLPVIGRIFTLNRQLDDDVAGPRAA